ncbi:MAG: mechanosensitive ion channel, partial [Bacteroidales bacterium]
ALLVLWIGLKLIKILSKGVKRLMIKRDVDISLQAFLCTLINITLKVLLILTVMGMVGIQVTSFIAMLGAAGLAVGMALQGTLQNFAGGVIVLILKPYRVGDYIEQGSINGTVKSIQIFNTILATPDNKIIIVPNTKLATDTLINYSQSDHRRVDVSIGISYGSSVDKAREVMLAIAKEHPYVLQEPEVPVVYVTSLSDSSVDLQLRVWVNNTNYWDCKFFLNQAIYDKFNEEGISIPYNQLDVHIIK